MYFLRVATFCKLCELRRQIHGWEGSPKEHHAPSSALGPSKPQRQSLRHLLSLLLISLSMIRMSTVRTSLAAAAAAIGSSSQRTPSVYSRYIEPTSPSNLPPPRKKLTARVSTSTSKSGSPPPSPAGRTSHARHSSCTCSTRQRMRRRGLRCRCSWLGRSRRC